MPSSRRAALPALLLAALAPATAAAAPATTTFTTAGHFQTLVVGNDLSCQVTVRGERAPAYEPIGSTVGDCATYVLAGGTLYGPDLSGRSTFLPTPDEAFTADTEAAPPQGQQVSGPNPVPEDNTGVVASHVRLGSSGLRITQVDSVSGSSSDRSYTTSLGIINDGQADAQVTIYRVFLCYLQGGTSGDFGTFTNPLGTFPEPGCRTGPGVSPARSESLAALSTPGNWVVAQYTRANELLRGGPFPDTREDGDLLVGLSWTRTVRPTSSDGVAWGTSVTGPTDEAPPPPEPQRTGTATAESGTVRVRRPGGQFAELGAGESIPVGSVVDATKGTVRLTVAAEGARTRTGRFNGGMFKFTQARETVSRTRKRLTARLALQGGTFAGCRARAAGEAGAARRRVVRYLKARASGRFKVIGRHSSGVVRGTAWTTSDGCDGTRTTVTQGAVDVFDFARRRTVTVRAGRSYLARARR